MNPYTFPAMFRGEHNAGVEIIHDVVSRVFNIPKEDILKKTRKMEIVIPRWVAISLVSRFTNLHLTGIRDIYGFRHHSAVVNAKHAFDDLYETDADFRAKYDQAINLLFSHK